MMHLTGHSREKGTQEGKGTVSLVGPSSIYAWSHAFRKVGKLETVLDLDGAAQYPLRNGNVDGWS